MGMLQTIKGWAKRIRKDALTLWFAQRHRDTPWLPKLLCIFTVAYALSPIDLIPDFIPILGYLDEVILLPAFIWLTLKLLPAHVIAECRQQAEAWIAASKSRIRSVAGAIGIALIWIVLAVLAWQWWTDSNGQAATPPAVSTTPYPRGNGYGSGKGDGPVFSVACPVHQTGKSA